MTDLGHAGLVPEQILKDHPHLEIEDIHAAQNYAADHLADEEIIFQKEKQLK